VALGGRAPLTCRPSTCGRVPTAARCWPPPCCCPSEIEDERGEKIRGRDGLIQLADEWRVARVYIDDDSPRREAFNIVFSMPVGTPPEAVRAATAEAARELFEGHRYLFVMHEDQGAPQGRP
jgi:hypothetical protein